MNKGLTFFAILFLVITMGIFKIPSLYFSVEEELLLEKVYERHIVPINIAPEAEEIYMVRAIRDIYWLNNKMHQSDDRMIEEEYDVLSKVIGQNHSLLDEFLIFTHSVDRTVPLSDGMYLYLRDTVWHNMEGEFGLSVHQESKTGKIIFLAQENNNVMIKISYYNYAHNENELAKRFCEYLGLNVLDDWTFSAEGMISKKASLKIVCHTSETAFLLYAAPLESQWEEAEEIQEMAVSEEAYLLPE